MRGIEERVDDIIARDGSLSLKSFEIKQDLDRAFWDKRANNRLFPEIRIALLNIAQDFLKSLSLDEVLDKNKFVDPNNLVKDVLFLGSLASYNYSSYSDVDLHLLVDLSILKLTPDQDALLKSYFNLKKNDWNASHGNLLVKGHDVELYVQDVRDENTANGIYSLVQDRWLKFPDKMPEQGFNEKLVKSKAMWYITRIDHLDEMLDTTPKFSWQIEKIHDICEQIKDKLVKGRKSSLNSGERSNELAVPNLVFKVLRRTGHMGKLNELIDKTYDLAKSLAEEETRCGFEVAEDCCCVATLGGDGFGDGKPALTKGDYHLPAVLTKNPLRRRVQEGVDKEICYHVSPYKLDEPKINQHGGCGTSFYGAGFYAFLNHDKVEEYAENIGDRGWYEYTLEIDPSANIVDEEDGLQLYADLVDELGDEVKASEQMVDRGIDGLRYFSMEDGDSIVLYNPSVARIVDCKPLRRYSKNVEYNESGSLKERLKNLFPNLPPVPTEEELRAKEETFHVGDRVKVVDNIRCIQKGKVGTISRIDPDDGHGWKLFIVDFDDKQYGSMGFQSGYINKVDDLPELATESKITLTVGQLRKLVLGCGLY